MLVSAQIHMRKSYPEGDGCKRRGLGELIQQERNALMNGIGAVIKEAPDSSLAPSTMCGHSKKMSIYKPGSGARGLSKAMYLLAC